MQKIFRQHPYQMRTAFSSLAAALIIFVILYITLDWSPYFLWIIAVSIVTFILFGIDKVLSKTNRVRVPENVLHLVTLLGGFPGQLIGRVLFNHKTNFKRHPAFNIVLIISIVLHGVIVLVLF